MRNIISTKLTARIILVILASLIVFHLSVIIGIMPAYWVWGEQADESTVLPLELIAIVINISFGIFILIKTRYLADRNHSKVVNIGLYVIFAFLLFRTVNQFISEVSADRYIFAPIAFILAILTLRLAIEK